MSRTIGLNETDARTYARYLSGIDATVPSVEAALDYHGYIQLDPLNVCGRMHDLILRNRVHGYEKGQLLRSIHGMGNGSTPPDRTGFEHYIPGKGILAAWPMSALPYIQAYLRRIHPSTTRRLLTSADRPLADLILRQLEEQGPATSDQFEHEGRAKTAWGTDGRLVKNILEKLFSAGHVLINTRQDFRRVYDLADRVASPLAEHKLPSDEELQRWLLLVRFRQRRLVSFKKSDGDIIGDSIHALEIKDGPTLCCLKEDIGVFDKALQKPASEVRLLAPLDPLIYDRVLTRRLWGFDFTWEVYTPPHLRKRGYYSLPALSGTEIVGDVEPRADWKTKKLTIQSKRLRRGFNAAPAVASLAAFLGLRPGRGRNSVA